MLALLASVNANADAVEIDGIYYKLFPKTQLAEVTKKPIGSYYSGKKIIPETITHDGVNYSVSSIGDEAFEDCIYLTTIIIPESVISIGEYAFYKCRNLTTVTIPNSVTSIGHMAFYNCSDLESVTIGNSVTSIGDYAFKNCTGLTSVHITDLTAWCNINFNFNDFSNPLYYAHHLYLNGEEIKDLVIPEGVTRIGHNAFGYCSGLTSVTIPESVTSIDDFAFQSCTGLTSVTIPNSVTRIGYFAFSDCSGLKEIKCLVEEPPVVNENSFNSVNVSNVTLYVPKESYQQYKEHTIWGKFDIAIMTGIELTQGSAEGKKDVYDTNGRRLQSAQRGINIIRYSDGSTKKVLMK